MHKLSLISSLTSQPMRCMSPWRRSKLKATMLNNFSWNLNRQSFFKIRILLKNIIWIFLIFGLSIQISFMPASISTGSLKAVQAIHEVTKMDRFLMKLWIEFESIRSSLMNHVSIPSPDGCLGQLLREEQRLITRTVLEQQ